MRYRNSELRDTAYSVADKAKELLHAAANDMADTTHKLKKQFNRTYPIVVDNVRDVAGKTLGQTREALSTTSHRLGDMAHVAGRQVRYAENSLLKVGAVYVLYKLLAANNSEVANCSARVKSHINERPIESALLALGAGYVVARLLR